MVIRRPFRIIQQKALIQGYRLIKDRHRGGVYLILGDTRMYFHTKELAYQYLVKELDSGTP